MPARQDASASVVIGTYNRARLLEATLESLRRTVSGRPWDVVVIDNNSNDDTRQVVSAFAATAPVPVIYLHEARQGKSNALNTGLAHARGDILLLTDDDVEVDPHWLEEACLAFDRDPTIDYAGGPVSPIWGATPPGLRKVLPSKSKCRGVTSLQPLARPAASWLTNSVMKLS